MLELKIFLLRAGYTKNWLAARLGISRQYLHDIFRGERKALHIRARMVEELGFPPELVGLSSARKVTKRAA